MKPELVVHLIGRLQESADGARKGEGRHEVLAFVEVLAVSGGQVILTRYVSGVSRERYLPVACTPPQPRELRQNIYYCGILNVAKWSE